MGKMFTSMIWLTLRALFIHGIFFPRDFLIDTNPPEADRLLGAVLELFFIIGLSRFNGLFVFAALKLIRVISG